MQISEQSNTNKCEHNYLSPIVHHQDSQSCVSGQKRRAAHKCVTGATKWPFSILCISITTGLISIKFTYLCPPYTQLYKGKSA